MYVSQTPSCGYAAMQEAYNPKLQDTVHQFDWNLLNSMNPEFIYETKDNESLEKIIYSLMDSNYGRVEQQFLPFPLSRKFFEIMKLSVKYLMKEISKTKQQMKDKDNEIAYLKHKFEKQITKLDAMNRPKSVDVTVVHSCPKCHRAFKALTYLDKHMKKEHLDILDAWVSLREGTPYGAARELKQLKDEVEDLRMCLNRQEIISEKLKGEASSVSSFIESDSINKTRKKRKVLKNAKQSSLSSSKSYKSSSESSVVKPGVFQKSVEVKPKAADELFVSSIIEESTESSQFGTFSTESLLEDEISHISKSDAISFSTEIIDEEEEDI